ncbi:MAG: zinc ribbon domain-containing protein [Clostridia bacterium]|nr:zinc ribbon domain-containing protein [Clostridia bacterium]MBQ3014542.1 zinc ribbon domain-containing protein [Clostridia bacterium]
MKYCSKCGLEVEDTATFCSNCGNALAKPTNTDNGTNIAFLLIGLFFPLAGLILYLVYHESAPQKAKAAGKGALIGVCISIGISILTAILSVAALLSFTTSAMSFLPR